jgi:hypothetical protein
MSILNEELSLFDRSTLIFWRASNLIGWSVVALLAGFTTNFLLFNLNFLASHRWVSSFGGGIPTVLGPLNAVVAGVVIGSIVGRRVYRFVMPLATVVGGFQAAMWGDLLETWLGERPARVVLGAAAGLVAARISWGRRPVAMRGGRGAQ